MNKLKRPIWLPLIVLLCLVFAGCAGTRGGESGSSGQEEGGAASASGEVAGVVMNARFQGEDGSAISQGSIRISGREHSVTYPLEEGEVWVPGLPRAGTLMLYLLDTRGSELCSTPLHLSTGAVIDASTDQEGEGYVVLRPDTSQITLLFTRDGEWLQCALILEP